MSVDLPSSTDPHVLKRNNSIGCELEDRESEIGDRVGMIGDGKSEIGVGD